MSLLWMYTYIFFSVELYNIFNFEIKNNTPDQAKITDTPPMSQDFPPVLPGNGCVAGAQVGH